MTEKATCTATSKRSHERCRRAPTPGATVCAVHGGAAPQVRRKAAQRLVEQEARARLSRTHVEPVSDPFSELQRLAGEVTAFKSIVSGIVENLSEWRYEGQTGEQQRAELTLYLSVLAETRQTLGVLARLHVDDRVLRLREREVDLFEKAMALTFTDLALTEEQHRNGRTLIARHLRALTAG